MFGVSYNEYSGYVIACIVVAILRWRLEMSLLVSVHAIRFKKLACHLYDSFSNEDFRDAQNGYYITLPSILQG